MTAEPEGLSWLTREQYAELVKAAARAAIDKMGELGLLPPNGQVVLMRFDACEAHQQREAIAGGWIALRRQTVQ